MHDLTDASRYLLRLAARLAKPYADLPETRAILVTGSASEGVSDFYSDLDMILYYDQLPPEEALAAACQQNGGDERSPIAPREDEQFLEHYTVNGVECQFAHSTVAAWEAEIDAVLVQHEVARRFRRRSAAWRRRFRCTASR